MKIMRLIPSIALSCALIALAGCSSSSTPTAASTAAANNAMGNNSALANGLGPQVVYQTDANGMAINPMTAPANQTYYFAFDANALNPNDLPALNTQANYLATHQNAHIRLEGNTDKRGSREYNVALGWRRDQAVARILEQQGVRPSQIQMVSFGKEKPAVMGDDSHAWSLNRRVNLIYKGQR